MKLPSLFKFAFAAAACLAASAMFGQGVTTATLNGFVTDPQNKPVAGATVTAVHVPTNTTLTATTGPSGHFVFTGVPVGGPFTISATAPGFTVRDLTGVQTALGESTDVMLKAMLPAANEVVTLEKFNVTAEI